MAIARIATCTLCAVLLAGDAPRTAPAESAADPDRVELTVYAAVSLREALDEAGPLCGRETGATVVFNFGSSNDLARQIVAANKADVFLSADEGWMDQVAAQGLVDSASRRELLSNRLVVVVPADSGVEITSAGDLAGPAIRHLSLANPEAVPAGKYAKAWLEKTGTWNSVKDRVAPAPDVRAALAAVEAGAAQAAVVYATDAAIAKRAKVAYTVPESEGPKITYPVAALRDRPHLGAARRFIACLSGQEARRAFVRFGFIVLDAPGVPAPLGSLPADAATLSASAR
jgi:molybdate transport system substrate-binding protein